MISYSIIIPHYNIPDLLVRAIRSIPIRQDIQVIVIDDCSPNVQECKAKLEILKRSDIEFYSTPKCGSAGRARNVGLEHAKGKWLVFVDADDFLAPDAITFFDRHINDAEDVLYFKSKRVKSDDIDDSGTHRRDPNVIVDYALKTGDDFFLRYHSPQPWGKMIRKELVEEFKIKYSETTYSNDVLFAFLIGAKAAKVKACDEIVYILTERTGSLSYALANKMTLSKQEIIERFQELYRCCKLMQKWNIPRHPTTFEFLDGTARCFYHNNRKFRIIYSYICKEHPKDAFVMLIAVLSRPFRAVFHLLVFK